MSQHNPFIRGFQKLTIQRVVVIDYDDKCPMAFRKLEAEFETILDRSLIGMYCLFNDDTAFVRLSGATVSLEKSGGYPSSGVCVDVVYQVLGYIGDTETHIADRPTPEDARMLIEQISFNNGFYNRCWEISSGHVTEEGMQYLIDNCGTSKPMFESFELGDTAAGIKLYCTPWTDDNLRNIVGKCSAAGLRQEMVDAQIPDSLINLLFLAANADTRIVILDQDASTLDGLPEFDW